MGNDDGDDGESSRSGEEAFTKFEIRTKVDLDSRFKEEEEKQRRIRTRMD